MQISRFDAIAGELERLAAEIAAINRQPFDPRIDLQSLRQAEEQESEGNFPLPPLRDWRLSR